MWSGEDAAKVQTTLRKLHATAGAPGDAMLATGVPLSWYAERLRHYRDTIGRAAAWPGPNRLTQAAPRRASGAAP